MEALKERIRREGRVLPGNIIKVDGFLNHRVDTAFMEELADEFARYFDVSKITMVLTAEASGIANIPAPIVVPATIKILPRVRFFTLFSIHHGIHN